jgi:hypothetical protein
LAVKVLLAPWLARAVVRGGHATAGEVAACVVAWAALVAGFVALVRVLVPPERASLTAVAIVVALLVPFNRLAAAPLLLTRNRYR